MISVTVLSVSEGEFRRLEVLRDVDRGGLPVSAAAQLLGRSERQVWRLLRAFRSDGVSGLISKKRGRLSNRKTAAAVRAAALWIVRQNYADFGPTLAAEKLANEHGFSFSSETLRKWMIADRLWLDRKQRQSRIHQPRPRRDCVGEPVAFYSDKHGVFRVNHPGALGGDGMTQFGRALHAISIDIICANSSPAKGRVERAHKTLQDRLVKELRLAGVRTLAAGNALLPGFIAAYNARFAKAPANKKDLHRQLGPGDG